MICFSSRRTSRSKAGSVGLPHFFTTVRIADDSGLELPAGEAGEIQVVGPNAIAAYWNNPAASAELYTPDGWLRTGDIGFTDEQGFFFIADRLPRDGEGVLDLRSRDELEEYLVGMAREKFRAQLAQFGDHSEDLLRYVVLSTIDERWKDHLYDLDGLKASIGFRGWGQKDPLIEYKQEAYEMFVGLMTDIHSSIARLVFRARLEVTPMPALPQMPLMYTGPELDGYMETAAGEDTSTGPAQRPADAERSSGLGVNPRMAVRPPQPPVDPRRLATNRDETPRPPAASAPEVGRNDPCPCGSGKKYKKCHGAGLV